LNTLVTQATASPMPMSPAVGATNAFVPSLAGKANVHLGTLAVPYYLTAPSSTNPTAPLSTFWTGASGAFLTRF